MYITVLVYLFQGLKRLYKTKQEPFGIIAVLVISLMMLDVLFLILTALSKAILGAAGTKMSFGPRLFAVELAYLRGCVFLAFGLGLYLLAVRFPTMAINRRRQRKELARLGWQVRKAGERLAVSDFNHLVIIGINLWKSEDMGG